MVWQERLYDNGKFKLRVVTDPNGRVTGMYVPTNYDEVPGPMLRPEVIEAAHELMAKLDVERLTTMSMAPENDDVSKYDDKDIPF